MIGSALLVGDIDAAVRSDFYVAVNSPALSEIINWNARAEGKAAVVATRAKGGFGILRAIVKSIGVQRVGRRWGVAFGL